MDSPKHLLIRENKKEIEDKVFSPPPPTSTVSPSHEFSFTISLQSTPPLTPALNITNSCTDNTSTSSLTTLDLSPADKIFLGGQLLPLQSVCNTKTRPRNSNSSAENFTLPLDRVESDLSRRYNTSNYSSKSETTKIKPKSMSDIFRIWRAKNEDTELRNDNKTKANKKRLELGQVLKKFMGMVENIFSNNRRERERRDLQKRPHSFLVPRERERWRRKTRGQRSAPASMRGSPSHSGHFSMGSINKLSSSSDESTMEELQNAIEAAIAHCKSSIGTKGGEV